MLESEETAAQKEPGGRRSPAVASGSIVRASPVEAQPSSALSAPWTSLVRLDHSCGVRRHPSVEVGPR